MKNKLLCCAALFALLAGLHGGTYVANCKYGNILTNREARAAAFAERVNERTNIISITNTANTITNTNTIKNHVGRPMAPSGFRIVGQPH